MGDPAVDQYNISHLWSNHFVIERKVVIPSQNKEYLPVLVDTWRHILCWCRSRRVFAPDGANPFVKTRERIKNMLHHTRICLDN